MKEAVTTKDVEEQANEYLFKLNERRLRHAIADITTEMNRPGGGKDYYGRLLVEENNHLMDEYEFLRGANRGEIFHFRYTHSKTLGIGVDEIEVEDRPSTRPFERGGVR